MSDFNDFYNGVKRVADKAVKKTGEVADLAAKYVKLHRIDSKLSSRYEVLGKLTYKQLKTGESYAEKIALYMESIDKLRAERKALCAEIEAEKMRQSNQDNVDGEISEAQIAIDLNEDIDD